MRGETDRILVAVNPTDQEDEAPSAGWHAGERLAGTAVADNGLLHLPPFGYGIWSVD